MKLNKLATALMATALIGFGASAQAEPTGTAVALELALLVDVSGSVSSAEYDLQRGGYVNAFRDAGLQAAIAGLTGGIAVTYIEWSTGQSQAVGWTHITNASEADAFADAIAAVVRTSNNNTGPGSAINFAAPQFATNNYTGARLVIDVSGDGSENTGADTSDARDAAVAAGITINGLPILGSEANLDTWYQNNIVGGNGSFLVVASDFAAFEGAVLTKIGREVSVPEPATLALLGLGLVGLGALRRKA